MAVTTQPDSTKKLMVVGPEGHREWSSGLCDCCQEYGACMCTCCCLPCFMCTLASRLNECPCLTCFVPGAFISMRTKVRTMGDIKGSICKDCMVACCCSLCAVCQLSREMDAMGL